jgi:hypothetical protein
MNEAVAAMVSSGPALVLLVAGVSKAYTASTFTDDIRTKFLPPAFSRLAGFVAGTVVAAEVGIACWSILRPGKLAAAALMLAYLMILGASVLGTVRHLGTCNCFGRLSQSEYSWHLVARNVLFAAVTGLSVRSSGQFVHDSAQALTIRGIGLAFAVIMATRVVRIANKRPAQTHKAVTHVH